MTYKTAFTDGTSSWKELDAVAAYLQDETENELDDMTPEEKEYILKQMDDFVANWLWDMTPQSHKDAVAAWGGTPPGHEVALPDPTRKVCDHCGRAAVIDPKPFSDGTCGWKHADDNYFGCYEHSDTDTLCEVGGTNVAL